MNPQNAVKTNNKRVKKTMATKITPKTNPKANPNSTSAAATKAADAKKKPSVTNSSGTKPQTPKPQTAEEKTKTKRTPKVTKAMEDSKINLPDFPEADDFVNYTDEQLKKFVDNYNKISEDGDRTTAPITVTENSTREEIIDSIIETMGIDNAKSDQSYANCTQKSIQLPISAIKIHPDNPRQPVDYVDPDLLNSIKKSGGTIGTPVVVKATNAGFDEEDVYYVVSGNRSFLNYYKYVTEDLKQDASQHFIDVSLREYHGTLKEVKSQIFFELAAANDKAQSLTVINRLELVNKRLADGAKKTVIAEEMGISSSMISQIVALNLLPQPILDRVHFEGTKDRLCKLTKEQLKAFSVPFTVKGDTISIDGITYKNAQALVGVIPKKPARSNFRNEKSFNEAFDEWVKTKDNIVDYFLDEKIINMAVSESENTFAKKLTDFLKEVHILPGGKNPPPIDVPTPPKPSQTDVEDYEGGKLKDEAGEGRESSGAPAGVDTKIKPDSNSSKPEERKQDPEEKLKQALIRNLYKDPAAFAEMLDDGTIDFVNDWHKPLMIGLKAGNDKMQELCKLMISNGVISKIDED